MRNSWLPEGIRSSGLVRQILRGCSAARAALETSDSTRDCNHSKVVILAVLLSGVGEVRCRSAFAQEGFDTRESEEGALLVFGFGDSVGEQEDAIRFVYFDRRLGEGFGCVHPQRHGACECYLPAIEVRRRMAGCGKDEPAIFVKTNDQTGSEPALSATVKTAVQFGEYLSRLLSRGTDDGEHSDDHGNDHGGVHAFAAHVADDGEAASPGEWDELEEIAAHFGGGTIDAFDPIAGNVWKRFRNHDALSFARSGHFALEAGFFGLHRGVPSRFAD